MKEAEYKGISKKVQEKINKIVKEDGYDFACDMGKMDKAQTKWFMCFHKDNNIPHIISKEKSCYLVVDGDNVRYMNISESLHYMCYSSGIRFCIKSDDLTFEEDKEDED